MGTRSNALLPTVMLMLSTVSVAAQSIATRSPDETASAQESQSGYILGPEDQIAIRVVDGEEISNKPVPIDTNGYIRLPLIGRMRAGGLTVEQLEAELSTRLRPFIREPDVSVSIAEFHSQPVAVIGCVKSPGIHQLRGRKTLIEILSLAGGLSPEAGPAIKITRRRERGRIPLFGATDDPTGQFSIAEIKLKAILSGDNPAQNIVVCPDDVISIPRAEMIYVTGQVVRSGGFVLNERESLSVLQALSLAGGLDRFASPQNSRILRTAPGTSGRVEIAVDLKRIVEGQGEDLALKADDILFIPSSAPKKAALRAVEAAIQLGTGIVIWRR